MELSNFLELLCETFEKLEAFKIFEALKLISSVFGILSYEDNYFDFIQLSTNFEATSSKASKLIESSGVFLKAFAIFLRRHVIRTRKTTRYSVEITYL